MSKPIKKQNTSIDEQARRDFDISRDDYALCAYVQFRIADPRAKNAGWCCDPKEEIADWVGISRPGLYKMIDRLSRLNLLEIDAATGFLRVTVEWIEVIGDGKNKRVNKVDSVNKVNTDCKQSLQPTVNKVTPNIEVKSDKEIEESDIEEKEKKRAQLEEANRLIDEFFDLKTEEPKSPPVAPAPPQVADPIEYATDIAVRYVQANLANYKNWHDIRFVKMPETPQAMRTDIEDFFVYWQRKQPETGGAYQQPEKWFIQNYRTWIGTGKRLKAQHPANAPRSTAQPTSSKQVRRPGGINDF